jgi:hypothetical protein
MTDTTDNPTSTDSESFDVTSHVRVLLAKDRMIAAIWSIEDVKGLRPDLSDEQAWEVLQQAEDIHDAEWGINWTTLETVASDLFPEPDDSIKTAID